MTIAAPRFLLGFAALCLAAGCAHIDLGPEGNPDRVLNGVVNLRATVPAGTLVVVRVVDRSNREMERPAQKDLPIVDRPRAQPAERVLGEQIQNLAEATSGPVPFRVEYHADDATLRRGLHVEARVSVDGKVRHRNVTAHVVTLASSPYKQEVAVDPVQ
jgi:hypothetical protein